MNAIDWIRRTHRWVASAFALCVFANLIAMAWGPPPSWITYCPLLPLAILMPTGLTLLARSSPPAGLRGRARRRGSHV